MAYHRSGRMRVKRKSETLQKINIIPEDDDMTDITGRDNYIIGSALAYAIECINRLPVEWQEKSDRDDMEKLLIAICGEDFAGTFREAARDKIEGHRLAYSETPRDDNVVSIRPATPEGD